MDHLELKKKSHFLEQLYENTKTNHNIYFKILFLIYLFFLFCLEGFQGQQNFQFPIFCPSIFSSCCHHNFEQDWTECFQINYLRTARSNLSELEFVIIGICQNWKMAELENSRIGICQSWNLSELEFVRIGICQNWNLGPKMLCKVDLMLQFKPDMKYHQKFKGKNILSSSFGTF